MAALAWAYSIKAYARETAGSTDEHKYVAPDLFTAETPLGTYQGMTDQVVLSRTPGAFRTVLVPRGSIQARVAQQMSRPRIAIVGGGFGGLAAASALRGCTADVVLIDRRNHNTFQPLLHRVATALRHRSGLPLRSPTARLKRSAVSLPAPLTIYSAMLIVR